MSTPGPHAPDLGLVALDGGTRCALTIRALAGARRCGFAGLWNGTLKIATSVAPEAGRANEALRDEVAAIAGVRPSHVRLVAGATAREKRFEIDALESVVRARITALVADVGEHGA